jgi:glycosyltransferase involved in cell wall biosynthesis
MKTLTAYCITQNQMDIVGYALHNPLLECDEVVVVDGISEDSTEWIIKNKANKLNMEHKLRYFKNEFVDLNTQRNFALSKMQTDHIMYVDSDEIFTREHLRLIMDFIEDYKLLLIPSIHYYIDWYHRANGGHWETTHMMPRVFANEPGLKYQDWEPDLGDHTLMVNGVYFIKHWANNTLPCNKSDIVCHHLGHALGRDHEMKKIRWFLTYEHPELQYQPKPHYQMC